MKTNQKNKKGKMTLDKLALMVGRGFNEVYDRMSNGFDEAAKNVNARFEQVDTRFEQIDERFDKIEMKLDSLERRIFAIENILTEHGRDIREIKGEIKKIRELGNADHEKILELEQRVKVLEVKIR